MMVLRTVLPAIIRAQPPAGGPPPEVVLGFLHPLMMFFGVMLLAKALAGIAAGIGILQRADWSRMLAIVVACISLLSVPFGTAIGVYTLWVLLSPNATAEFRGQGHAAVV
jgi:phage shock protein PspC (stress-responsive transcriptional regulator)